MALRESLRLVSEVQNDLNAIKMRCLRGTNALSALKKYWLPPATKISDALNESPTDLCIQNLTLTDILKIKYDPVTSFDEFSQNVTNILADNRRKFVSELNVPYTRRGQRTRYSDWPRAGRSADRGDFSLHSRVALGLTQPPIPLVPGYCRG